MIVGGMIITGHRRVTAVHGLFRFLAAAVTYAFVIMDSPGNLFSAIGLDMATAPRFRNLKIGLLLAVCYVAGMAAAFYTTELVRLIRRGGASAPTEQGMAQVTSESKL